MEYIIASFRSRSQVFSFSDMMKKSGLNAEIVSTPREIALGCGLAVKIDEKDITLARILAGRYYYENFSGFYKVVERDFKREVKPIY